MRTRPKSKIPPTAQPLTAIHHQLADFLAQLSSLKILDPACGSGNFLYVAIQQLLSLEKQVITFAAQPPISLRLLPRIRPTQLLGIEINPYAAELAQVSIWIGFLQWLHLNGFPVATDTPILSQLQTIENRDAILDLNGTRSVSEGEGTVAHAQRPPAQAANTPTIHTPPQSKIENQPSKTLPTPALWPDAHFIIGNPPFLGFAQFRAYGLSDPYIASLHNAYDIPHNSDLCCYWFELARRKIEQNDNFHAVAPGAAAPQPEGLPHHSRGQDRSALSGPVAAPGKHHPRRANPEGVAPSVASAPDSEITHLKSEILDMKSAPSPFPNLSLPRAGLLATQAIRGSFNREVLARIVKAGQIFDAWSDRQWVLDGANVRVSIICFDDGKERTIRLDGDSAPLINVDITTGFTSTAALPLPENSGRSFEGDQKGGDFDLDWVQARAMLSQPNPNGCSSLSVLVPRMNASDITGRSSAGWIVDFPDTMPLSVACFFEAPFKHIEQNVKPERLKNREEKQRSQWWIHKRPRPEMRKAIAGLSRFLVTPRVAKYRLFCWLPYPTLADSRLFVFAFQDDYMLGVLQSSIHEVWTIQACAWHGDGEEGARPTYNTTTCFETFPLPWPPGKEPSKHPAYKRIAEAAKELNDLREHWLNPPELLAPLAQILDATDKFLDVPAEARPLIRHSALMAQAAQSPTLKKRTLTNLYNERPTWLQLAHEKLDRAVLAAYAAIDPAGNWSESWATLYTETGAGQPLPAEHPQHANRAETDQKILANLLRLNLQRASQFT